MSKLLRLTEEEYRDFVGRGLRAQAGAQQALGTPAAPEPSPNDRPPQARTRGRRGSNPETALHDLIRRALQIHPAVAWLVRMNTGMFVVEGRKIRAAFVGCPDLVGQMSSGHLLGIEVKRPGKNPTTEQAAVLERISRHGGCAGCAHSVGEAIDLVAAFRKGK